MNISARLLLACAVVFGASDAAAAEKQALTCHLAFTTSQWSAVYERADGSGTVSCDDGSRFSVTIAARGVGLTAGKWQISDGNGTFTHVRHADDVLGTYVSVSGNAGAKRAGTVQLLSKGKVSLELTGKGTGFDLGVAVSRFEISRTQGPGAK